MIQYIIKVAMSAVLIVIITEASKKSSLIGGIFASVPLVSVLSLIWLYIDTKSIEKVSRFSTSVFLAGYTFTFSFSCFTDAAENEI